MEKLTEYCVIGTQVCLPSAEWASWTQAVFSVIAIVAAILVMHWQHALARTERIREQAWAKSDKLETAFRLALALHMAFRAVRDHVITTSPADRHFLTHQHGKVLAIITAFDKFDLTALVAHDEVMAIVGVHAAAEALGQQLDRSRGRADAFVVNTEVKLATDGQLTELDSHLETLRLAANRAAQAVS
jgi:hypothetical protein